MKRHFIIIVLLLFFKVEAMLKDFSYQSDVPMPDYLIQKYDIKKVRNRQNNSYEIFHAFGPHYHIKTTYFYKNSRCHAKIKHTTRPKIMIIGQKARYMHDILKYYFNTHVKNTGISSID